MFKKGDVVKCKNGGYGLVRGALHVVEHSYSLNLNEWEDQSYFYRLQLVGYGEFGYPASIFVIASPLDIIKERF